MIERLEARRMLVVANYTWGGDFDFNGQIDADDYVIIDGATLVGKVGGDPFGEPPAPVNVQGTARGDRIRISSGADFKLSVSVNGTVTQYERGPLKIFANGGNDVVWIDPMFGNTLAATIYGGGGDDSIFSGGANDRIFAGEGNDLVTGGDGNDTIYGEGGDDSIRGGGGSDNIDGGDGIDTLRGDGGNDRLGGGANPDRLRGSLGNDTLEGGGGRDLMAGEAGDDSLLGGTGNDVVDGGAGADVVRGGTDHDLVVVNDLENDDYDLGEVSAGEVSQASVTIGTSGLTKTGAGTLTLSGTNSYSGATMISSGTLQIDSNAALPQATPSIEVIGVSSLRFGPDHFNYPETTLHVGPDAAVEFDNAAVTATLGQVHLDPGAHVVFDLGPGMWGNTINVVKGGGLQANGAVIQLRPHSAVSSGEFTLITFPPGDAAAVANFTLKPVRDTNRKFTLNVDQAAGKVTLTVGWP